MHIHALTCIFICFFIYTMLSRGRTERELTSTPVHIATNHYVNPSLCVFMCKIETNDQSCGPDNALVLGKF